MNSSALAIHDLFHLAFTEPVTWLANGSRSGEPVEWITNSVEEAQPGDILLLPALAATGANLAQAQTKEVVAVLLVGEGSAPGCAIPDGLAVAVVKEGDLRSVERLLLTVLVNQRAALIERSMRIHSQLSQLAAGGSGLQGLVHSMADISGRGVFVQDKRGQMLAEQTSSALQLAWESILKQLWGLNSLPSALLDRKKAVSQVIKQDIPGGLSRLVIPIIAGDVARGYLSLVAPFGELDTLDFVVAEQGASVCAVEMARAKAIREAEKRLKGDLLNALLQDNLTPRDARLWAQTMEIDLSQAHVALRFAWDGPASPSRRRLETLINGEAARLDQKILVNPMGVEVVCFCEMPEAGGRPEAAIRLGMAVLEQGRVENSHQLLCCGIGAPAPDLSEWRISFRQAGQALEMARRLKSREALFFPDLSVYRLLLQIEHSPELIAFQEEILGPLLAFDSGRELIHTLEAYFEHNGNLSHTAEALFIHRNTLIYRMERIASITHLNLEDPETRLAVQLGLHIYRMQGNQPQ